MLDEFGDAGKDNRAESIRSAHVGEGPERQFDILISFPTT